MRNGLATPKRGAKGGFVPLWILVLVFLTLLFVPIPFRYEIVNCAQPLRYPDQSRPCPGGLTLGWSPSIAQVLYKRIQSNTSSIESEPEVPKSPWKLAPGWKVYDGNSFTIDYPPGWTVQETQDRDGNPQIYLTSINSKKAAFSSRKLPETYISTTNPYSTNDAICVNQTCTETKIIQVLFGGKHHEVSVIQGSINSQFDFYTFSFITGTKVHVQGYSESVDLKIFASYATPEEEEIIKQIIPTYTTYFRLMQ